MGCKGWGVDRFGVRFRGLDVGVQCWPGAGVEERVGGRELEGRW